MEIIYSSKELIQRLAEMRQFGRPGFVPTMGALHKGHLSLVEKAAGENKIVVVSIFVNPNQFNNRKDLEKYPRNLESDIKLLEPAGAHILFAPANEEIYPEPDTRVFDFEGLDQVMEGKFRPGHFNGVAQVVTRLFELVKPDKAYFGEKDFQQLAIIKLITRKLKLPVEIVSCATVREANGLAMSSRNELLTPEQRKNAGIIFKTLSAAKNKSGLTIHELKRWITAEINKNCFLDVEYVEIVDQNSLKPIRNRNQKVKKVICAAVWCGDVRLIDNFELD